MPGYDLTGLFTGSEGTMALVTKIMVRLLRKPEMVKTILAIYDENALDFDDLAVRTGGVEDCGATVAELTARAIVPVAVEMLDGVMLRMVEEATHAGYPLDAAAVLLIELEGLRENVEEPVSYTHLHCACVRRRFDQTKDDSAESERSQQAARPVELLTLVIGSAFRDLPQT